MRSRRGRARHDACRERVLFRGSPADEPHLDQIQRPGHSKDCNKESNERGHRNGSHQQAGRRYGEPRSDRTSQAFLDLDGAQSRTIGCVGRLCRLRHDDLSPELNANSASLRCEGRSFPSHTPGQETLCQDTDEFPVSCGLPANPDAARQQP
jgi:hypothetical protein